MFKKFANKIFGPPEDKKATEPANNLRAELRGHFRYKTWRPDLITILNTQGQNLECIDLSYGGLGLATVNANEMAKLDAVVIVAAGRRCRIPVNHVHSTPTISGFTFVHESGESLLFLRSIIEFLRCGSTMIHIAPEHLKDDVQAREVYRGDGPTDLWITHAATYLLFRDADQYLRIAFEEGKISTGKSMATGGTSAAYGNDRSAPDHEPDKETLLKGIFILAAINDRACQIKLGPMLDAMLECLGPRAI